MVQDQIHYLLLLFIKQREILVRKSSKFPLPPTYWWIAQPFIAQQLPNVVNRWKCDGTIFWFCILSYKVTASHQLCRHHPYIDYVSVDTGRVSSVHFFSVITIKISNGLFSKKVWCWMTLLLLYQVQMTTPLTVSILSSVAPWPSRFISFSFNTGQPRRLVGLRVERAKMPFFQAN